MADRQYVRKIWVKFFGGQEFKRSLGRMRVREDRAVKGAIYSASLLFSGPGLQGGGARPYVVELKSRARRWQKASAYYARVLH